MPKVQLEDGTILQFDGNYNQKQISDAVDEYVLSTRQNQQVQPEQQEPSFLEKAGNFAQGIPQGLGNKFVGAVQAATGAIAPNSQFARNLADQVKNLNQRQSQLPASERAGIVGGEIAGDLAATAASPLARGAGFVGNAAASGAISGLTTPLEDSSNSARLGEVAKDTALGAAFGKGSQLVGEGIGAAKEGVKNIVKGVKARVPEELQVVGQALKQKATDLYDAADSYGVKFKPKAAQKISKQIGDAINEGGPLFKANHGATMSVVDGIQQDILKKGNKIGLADLDQYSQALKDVVRNNTDIAGKMNSDGYKALQAVNKVDDILRKLPDNYLVNPADKVAIDLKNQASKQYHTYRKFEKISDLAEKAAGDPNKIKSIVYRFISNKKNLQGFNPAEIKALKRAANLNTAEGIFKMVGKFGLDRGTSVTFGNTFLPAAVATGAFAAGGAKASLGAVTLGTVARQAQKYLARGKLDDALKIIQSSGDPAKVIAKIPNRKIQEKLLNQVFARGGAAAISEGNKGSPVISDANAGEVDLESAKQFIKDRYKAELPEYSPSEEEIDRFARQYLERSKMTQTSQNR